MFQVIKTLIKPQVDSGNPPKKSLQFSADDFDDSLQQIRNLFRVGDLDVAGKLCRQVLDVEPTIAEAWYYLGLIAYRQGRSAEALDCLRNATECGPDWAEACNHYGNALREHGRLDEAYEMYQRACGLKSDYAAPHYNIGLVMLARNSAVEAEHSFRRALDIAPDFVPARNGLALLLHNQGRSLEAVDQFREVLRSSPDELEALNNMGIALLALKQADEAVEVCRRAVVVAPASAEAHNTLGLALKEVGLIEEATACYRKAIELNLEYPEVYNNLGITLKDLSRLEEAEQCCRKALALRPAYAEALNNLGIVLKEQGRSAEAVAALETSLALGADNAIAWNNLGLVRRDQANLEAAIDCYRKAIACQPDYADAINNLGGALVGQAKIEEAVAAYRRAIAYQPGYADAITNLGGALLGQGKINEAVATFRSAVAMDAHFPAAYSNMLLTMQYSSHYSEEVIFGESRRWEELYGTTFRSVHPNVPEPDRRLRIGYVSPDFRRHSVSYFLMDLFEYHSKIDVSIVCYSDVLSPDEHTEIFRAHAESWRNIAGLSHVEVAGMVCEDKIDILVDLAGHTGKRLPLFARKPAPIQVTWLGYPGTTGLSSIDYRISDEIADPLGKSEHFHSEKLCRLPGGFLCYTPPVDAPEVVPAPCVTAGYTTFGSFNNLAKITPEVVELWSKLLDRLPDARIIIKNHSLADEATHRNFEELMCAHGIPTDRFDLRPWERSRASHLSVYGEIDIALDTFPYNGTTTTCEALWMGVPVITIIGERHAGRVGASILSRVGLADLVAESPDSYLEIVETLARDMKRLIHIRSTLRNTMLSSSLCDGAGFAATVENAYRRMWRGWCEERLKSN